MRPLPTSSGSRSIPRCESIGLRALLGLLLLSAASARATELPPPLRVLGSGDCPSPTALEERMRALAPAEGAGDRATLKPEARGRLLLELTGPDGAVLGERMIPAGSSCAERVEVAAVILATWLLQLAPQASAVEPAPPIPFAPEPIAVPASAAPAAAESGGTETAAKDPAARGTAIAEGTIASGAGDVETARRPVRFELAGGATASLAGGALAAGARLELLLAPRAARWSLHAAGFFETPRELSLPPGAVRWQRFGGALGGGFVLTDAPLELRLDADALLAGLHAEGSGFSSDQSANAFDPGLQLGAVLFLSRGSLRPWVGLWATAWLRSETPVVAQAPAGGSIPRVELAAGLGISWRTE